MTTATEKVWVTTVVATYLNATDAKMAFEVMRAESFISITRAGKTVTARQAYGLRSKYGSVRPADSALHDLFDPVADDGYYRPWPHKLEISTVLGKP